MQKHQKTHAFLKIMVSLLFNNFFASILSIKLELQKKVFIHPIHYLQNCKNLIYFHFLFFIFWVKKNLHILTMLFTVIRNQALQLKSCIISFVYFQSHAQKIQICLQIILNCFFYHYFWNFSFLCQFRSFIFNFYYFQKQSRLFSCFFQLDYFFMFFVFVEFLHFLVQSQLYTSEECLKQIIDYDDIPKKGYWQYPYSSNFQLLQLHRDDQKQTNQDLGHNFHKNNSVCHFFCLLQSSSIQIFPSLNNIKLIEEEQIIKFQIQNQVIKKVYHSKYFLKLVLMIFLGKIDDKLIRIKNLNQKRY